MKIIFTIATLFFIITLHAQCLSGDCKNGIGKYDFGWCRYEGSFKNDKPDGKGVMQYEDYSYNGDFKDGVEDGRGIITHKNGRKEDAVYYAGKKADHKPLTLAPGAYTSLEGKDPNCKSGNCRNGYGTYVYASGNIYTGNFKEFAREGTGIFYYTNGGLYNGDWHDNLMTQGVFTYPTGAQYNGTYDANGIELNGTVSAGTRRVAITNGKAVIIKQELYGYKTAEDLQREARIQEWDKKPKVNYTPWGFPEKSGIERDKEDFEKMMHESDARDRHYNEKWGG